jgi:hypothetical protein
MQQKYPYIDPKLNKHKKNWLHNFNVDFLHFIVIQKGKWQPKKIKWYRGMTKSVTQHSYFEKKANK